MPENYKPAAPVVRVTSGVPGLDRIVGGGLLRGRIYLASGPPGVGKTVFGNQFALAHATSGKRALYVTVQAETHAKMVEHLSSFTFFDAGALGHGLLYASGYDALVKHGVMGLSKALKQMMRSHRADVLILDGLYAVQEKASSQLEFRDFLQALSAHNSLTGCTALLLTTQNNKAADAEHAMVDGIFALTAELLGLKATRSIEVTKFRGGAQLTGKHTFGINDSGLAVYPRTEALYSEPCDVVPDPSRRLSFDIPKLDGMLHGGMVDSSSTMLLGSPGSGKTVLGLNFLNAGAARGEPGLYFGFAEGAAQLVQKATLVGLGDFAGHVDEERVLLHTRLPVETLPDALTQMLVETVQRRGIKRLFLDGLEPFSKEAIDPERVSRFLAALLNELKRHHVTVLAAQQTNVLVGPELHATTAGAEAIVDNIVFLRFFELRSQLYRLVSVLKMRDSESDPSLREFHITPKGVQVAQTFESAESILTGSAHLAVTRKRGASRPKRRRS